jgi:Ca2+-binding RTX toxin-like protein
MMNLVLGTNASETIDWFDGVTTGDDLIYGFGGNDWIYASGGNDEILGGAGADHIYGGSGVDTATYNDSGEGVVVLLTTGEGFGGTAEGDVLFNIENVTGSNAADWLVGNVLDNELVGLNGNDTLDGKDGVDILWGGFGNDILKGGGGADTLNGGADIDTASYNESSEGVVVSLLSDTAYGGDAYGDELNSIENLTGSDYGDNLYGDNGVNVLKGEGGADALKGFGGADILFGGSGADLLMGGTGQDIMNGGAGVDTFRFETIAECGLTAAPADQLPDFNEAIGEKIDLSKIDANTLVGGNQAFTFIGNNNAFTGAAGELRYMSTGYVEGDVNGDATADFYIAVNNVLNPVMHDYGFIL